MKRTPEPGSGAELVCAVRESTRKLPPPDTCSWVKTRYGLLTLQVASAVPVAVAPEPLMRYRREVVARGTGFFCRKWLSRDGRP
jgi:hypothetical protein